LLLAGDIGGTKSALALFSRETGPRVALRRRELPSEQFASLEAVVREYLRDVSEPIDAACFGVAGPVSNGRARATNLPWTIDEQSLARALDVPVVRILNDVMATAQAIPSLGPEESVLIVDGTPIQGGAIALIAAGTGLGEAYLVWDGTHYRAEPSEGGHADFAPNDAEQLQLLAYMQHRFEHVSYERVCSGIGIPNLYEFLQQRGEIVELPEVATRMAAVNDRTRFILDAALAPDPSPLCAATLRVFGSILGAESGNLALKVVATGGIYLAGGIPRNILPALRSPSFRDAFRAKGRLTGFMSDIPVRVITGDASLLGAAICGLRSTPQWTSGPVPTP
jgi:glucokinase